MKTKPVSKYNPNGLVDEVINKLDLKSDAALARKFSVAPPVISKIRHHRLLVGATFMIKCHEIAGMSFPKIRSYVGGAA